MKSSILHYYPLKKHCTQPRLRGMLAACRAKVFTMSRPIALLILACVLTTEVDAAGGSITGRVTTGDSDRGEPVAGATVFLRGTVRGTTTNGRGHYRLTEIPPGTYTLVFSMVGYQRQTYSDIQIREGKETLLNVIMIQTLVQTEQITITASKRELSLEDVPVSISVLDAAAIRQRNSLTVDDALRYIPGVNLVGSQVNVRGSSGYSLGAGSRVLMLLDGIPFVAGDTGELIFESIPAGQIDRIEVVKGASSALYGSNALGGVINVITKPIPEVPETTIRTYGGVYNEPSFGQWKWSDKARSFNGQSVALSRSMGDFGLALSFSRQLDDGYRQNDYRRRYNFSLKTREEISSSGSLTLNVGMLLQHNGQFLFWKNIDSALIPPEKHLTDNIKSTRYYVSSLYSEVFADNILFTGKFMWSHNEWGLQQTSDAGRTESLNDGYRSELLCRLVLGDCHTLTIGLDGNLDMIGGDMFEGRTIGGLALFGQDEFRLSDQWMITLGARSDFQSVGLSGEGLEINPKGSIVYSPWTGTTFRASYGRGFRVPSIPEAFIAAGSGPVTGVPNQGLKPEHSSSYEAGVRHRLGDFGALDASVFRSDFDNLIEPGLIVSGQSLEVQWRNVTKARVQGVETLLNLGFFEGGLLYQCGYTYVYPQDRTRDDLLRYRPRHVVSANALARVGSLRAGADFRYVSRVDRIDDELVEAGIIPDGDEREDIVVADFMLGAEFSIGGMALTMTLNVKNAFQRNYVELIGNLMPPRTYMVSLDARL